ncbi:Kae1-associated serine/threonine protein kinase [Candidatus Woesearchaeota archaeon]|nr:Kae1-associated serine/threonine protein kinase [Candidatus Woesearchaeota archaeon]
MKLIAQGAESRLFLEDNKIVKDRFRKTYRIREIDERLRKFRTKREAKVLEKLQAIGFQSPKLVFNNEKDTLEMEYIRGALLKNILNKKNCIKLCREIGEKVALLHNKDIIHHDLTTSNMILGKEIYFIDFGLSFFSKKIEDKAVDLHLLKEALESKHSKIWEKCYKAALESYAEKAVDSKDVLKRLNVVEARGRYKGKK